MGVVAFGIFAFSVLALAMSYPVAYLGRHIANVLLKRRSAGARTLGSSLDGAVRQIEALPPVPDRGLDRYVVGTSNLWTRVIFGLWPAGTVVGLLACVALVSALTGEDQQPGSVITDERPGSVITDERSDPGISNVGVNVSDDFDHVEYDEYEYDEYDDYEYDDYEYDDYEYDDYDSCVGDCTDMDGDGRTSNDYDADGDGLYETP